ERQNGNAVQSYGAQMLALRREQGRLEEMVDAVAAFAAQYPAVPAWRASLAWVYAELGRDEDARRELDLLAARDFADLPRDMFWLLSLWLVAEVVGWLDDTRRAATVYALLLPFADHCVTSGAAFCGGSLERSLGVLAGVLGRFDDAARHLAAAATVNERIRARPWLAHGELDRGRMLLRRGAAGDVAAAREHLLRAAEAARSLGMASLLARAEALLGDGEAAASAAGDEAVLRREGEYWTIAYRGSEACVRDARGVRLIALLVASPGRDFRATELAAWPAPTPSEADSGAAVEQAGLRTGPLEDVEPGPDARALADYRARITRLRDEVEEAERFNDPLRAARAREEMALLADELSGSHGARRRWATDAERARLAVTKAIRYSLRKIERAHPDLGALLATAVKTGVTCRYEPDPRARIRWLL
ncbi:MAG: hypothetical protein AB1689_22210, partial [Thermodesulfobacteriota bacterium]